MLKPPLGLATPRIHPLTFAAPSVMNDTPEAHAKVEREAKAILREMDRYFGREKFKKLVKDVTKGRKGNTPDWVLNALILKEWDLADGEVTKNEFSRELGKKHPGQYRLKSPGAVEKRLTRQLKARRQQDKKKAEREREFKEALGYRGKSLLGTK